MKPLTFSAQTLFLLTLLGTLGLFSSTGPDIPIVEATQFAPVSSFIPKRQTTDTALKNHVDTLTSSPPPPPPSTLNKLSHRGGAKENAILEVKPSFKVKFSYYLDIAGALLMGGFIYLWSKSLEAEKGSPPKYPYFAQKVLEEGFCNKDYPADPKKTQLICFGTDMALVVGSYLLAKSKGLIDTKYWGYAGYTIVHGIVHLSVKLVPNLSTGDVEPLTLLLLGLVMAFIPLVVISVLEGAPITEDFKYKTPLAIVIWIITVLGYGLIFNKREYALTYINVTIFMALFGLRSLLIGIKTLQGYRSSRKN